MMKDLLKKLSVGCVIIGDEIPNNVTIHVPEFLSVTHVERI